MKNFVPTRLVIAMMLFTASLMSYMVRVNMSINLIAMVEPSRNGSELSVPECKIIEKDATVYGDNASDTSIPGRLTASPDYGTRYEWSPKLQGLILGSYFWGYAITCIPGGFFAEKYGPTRTIMISTLLAGGLTIIAPLMAQIHPVALIVDRFLTGLTGGVIYPSLHCLVARWAPPNEKGKFVGSLLGGTFGPVITWPLLGAVINQWGWTWSFYINGGIVLAWCVLWVLLVSDTPEVHPRISKEEKDHIVASLADKLKATTTATATPPYRDIFTSVPFWALTVLHFGSNWGLFFLMTAGPNFMSSVLGFNLKNAGALASLPYLARLVLGLIFGSIGDAIRRRELVSTTVVRKGFVLFSHIVPGVLLLFLNVTGCDVIFSVALISMSLGSNGSATLTNLQNSQDLAPNFAGSLYGIINCISSITGFVTPLLVGYMTSEHNGLHEWHIIFSIGAGVYIICGLVFCCFGSGNTQPWNDKSKAAATTTTVEKNGFDNAAFDSAAFDTASDITIKMSDKTESTKF